MAQKQEMKIKTSPRSHRSASHNQNLTTDDTDETDKPAWAMRPTLSDENGFEKEQNSLAGTKRIDLCNGGEPR